MKLIFQKVFFVFFGTLLALVITEVCYSNFLEKPSLFYGPSSAASYVYHEKVGWQPVLDSIAYSKQALLLSQSIIRNGKQRILFLGDSVVAYGNVSLPFADMTSHDIDILNAGVPGYETMQEVALYRDYIKETHPELIILLFHPNDLITGVVAVNGDNGGMMVVNSYGDRIPVSPTLFWNSITYQFLTQTLVRLTALRFNKAEEITQSLKNLRQLSSSEGSHLLVVQLPWFKPYSEWSVSEKKDRELIKNIFKNSGVCWLDLFPTLEPALSNLKSIQDSPGDVQHPNREYGERMAKYIFSNGLNIQSEAGGPSHITIKSGGAVTCP